MEWDFYSEEIASGVFLPRDNFCAGIAEIYENRWLTIKLTRKPLIEMISSFNSAIYMADCGCWLELESMSFPTSGDYFGSKNRDLVVKSGFTS